MEARTFGSCRRKALQYKAPPVGKRGRVIKKKNEPKDFDNCVELPLIDADDDVKIVELITPPQLHLFLGLGNSSC